MQVTTEPFYDLIEIQYGPTSFSVGQGNGGTNSGASSFELTAQTPGEELDVYLRAQCDGEWTGYKGPKTVTVAGTSGGSCPTPIGLDADQYTSTSWRLDWYEVGQAGYYQVEYGPTGFIQGSNDGTIQNASENDLVLSLNEGVYDFYVRSNCGGQEWSNWAGPHSFYVPN